ncbi:MAG: NAD(P)H-hydrate dehydratase [Proteobacteria bacterium]|nr:NAD(P)H-hydrate dehydratase [Pseudomonadota bacterium]MBU1736564.1 NAD(P)H-hydrate dehydratase [Pseudomonadota bacterium]
MKLAFAKEIQKLDRAAIKTYAIPGIVLMENAGVGTVQAIMESFGELAGRTIMILAGPGNNGGDGLVIARHVLQHGGTPIVFLLCDPKKVTGDAAVNLKIVQKLDILVYPITDMERLTTVGNCIPDSDLVIDAIFGTGLKREITGHFAGAVDLINTAECPVISIDMPTGLNSDTGIPLGPCVVADMTVTYGLAKPGQLTGDGPLYTGRLGIVDIGIPPAAVAEADLMIEALEDRTISPLIPARPARAHKGTFGHLLILAGSRGKTGAALLCARGALRSGVGLVTMAAPMDLNNIFESALAEAMTLPLPGSTDGFASDKDLQRICKNTADKQAMVIGPGLGQDKATGRLVTSLYRESELPLVVDADALNLLAIDRSLLANPPAPRILTPHPGEMARLSGKSTLNIQANRLSFAIDFAVSNQVYLVLKGPGTIIAAPDGHAAINSNGNQLLAAGGSGDVLAGVIGSFLAQGLAPWDAACLGIYIHGMAADHLAANDNILTGLLPTELADELPAVLTELASC